MRPSGRSPDEIRCFKLETGVLEHAEGSCMVTCGNTRVLCTATLEERAPIFLKDTGRGWVTAEYGMLPRSTQQRMPREAARGKQSGRTLEIQRLIGRSFRAVTDLAAIGERQIRIDCDVIQADGGTRTAAISGGYVALHQCFDWMKREGYIEKLPLEDQVAAISCGIFDGTPVLDLDYAEDSAAETDANFVLTRSGTIVELQATAESVPFSEEAFMRLLRLARIGCDRIFESQRQALGI